MSEKFQLKGGISELNVGYNAKMEGYTNSSSDIPKLYEMLGRLTLIVKHMYIKIIKLTN